jgi:hypothetical protein
MSGRTPKYSAAPPRREAEAGEDIVEDQDDAASRQTSASRASHSA